MPEQKAGDEGTGDGRRTGPATPPGAPRWVRVSAITVGMLILLVVIAKLTGLGGEHGPGRHMSSNAASIPTTMQPSGQDSFR